MSASTAKRDLIPLIHRHLTEHGFQSAADELQRQSTQKDAPSSTSLVDIYSSWLKFSKRKVKSVTSKCSTDKKHKKAAPKKEKNTTTPKSGSLNKKTKKGEKSIKNVTEKTDKSNKSKTKKKKAAGGEDSDSDSSLDIEKWRKRVQQLTDADIAKLDSFNALTSPEPKKQRVRKPRAKANSKAETQNTGMVQTSQSETSDKSPEDVSATSSKTKMSSPRKKTPVSSLVNTNQEENISVEAEVSPVTCTPTQSPKKEKRKAPMGTPLLKPNKKRKKVACNDNVVGSGNSTDGNGCTDENIINISNPEATPTEESQVNTSNVETETKKKKKKKKEREIVGEIEKQEIESNAYDKVEDVNGNQTAEDLTEKSSLNAANVEVESLVKVKKSKKKKRDKAKEYSDSEQRAIEADAMTDTVISEAVSEKVVEETIQDTDEVPKKKKKKKDKKREGLGLGLETLEQLDETAIGETVCVEDNPENTFVKKKSKKKKRESLKETEDNTPASSENHDRNESSAQTQEAPATTQVPGSTKKKKSALESEIIKADATLHSLESESPKKKKKKSSKSTETDG